MTTTLTLNLPDDAIVSQSYDPTTNITDSKLTVAKTNIPFLARFLLNGIPAVDKEQISLELKESLAKAAGLKYVYRLPSLIRSMMIGASCGIALKTLAENQGLKPFFNGTMRIPAGLCARTMQCINFHPYLTALALAGTSLATNLVSNKTAYHTSRLLEGALSAANFGAKTMESGLIKVAASVKKYINFCQKNPKTGAAITVAIPMGLALWLKSAEIQNQYREGIKAGANALHDLQSMLSSRINQFRK